MKGFLIVILYSMLFVGSHSDAQPISGNALRVSNGAYLKCPLILDTLPALTIEAWLCPEALPQFGYPAYCGKDTTEGFGFVLRTDIVSGEGYLSIMLGGKKITVTGNGTRLPLNTWTHVAFTRRDSVWRLYRNGMLVGKGHCVPLIPTQGLSCGKNFFGKIDELRIWDHELAEPDIRRMMNVPLTGGEGGLLLYFSMDQDSSQTLSQLENRAAATGSRLNAFPSGAGTPSKLTRSSAPLQNELSPLFSLKNFPKHLQFFPRDLNSIAPVWFEGSIDEQGYDSVIIERLKENKLDRRISTKLNYLSNSASFSFRDSIHAELSRTTYRVLARKGNVIAFLAEAADLVAGDVYLINGQSNAHPTNNGYFRESPFGRSFGIQTPNWNYESYDAEDTSWGLSSPNGWEEAWCGPYLTGAWGQWMEEHIINLNHIPVCVINGAAGGSVIEEHQRNDTDKMDLATIYGKLLYRVTKSGLTDRIRGILWYQGEFNTFEGYYDKFKSLYGAWSQDYHYFGTLPKVYVMQVRPGCYTSDSKLREIQRTLPDSFPNITVASTVAIPGHDVCHYFYYGHVALGDMMYSLVARDFYGLKDTIDLDPPNIGKAVYLDSAHTRIGLLFRHASKGVMITPDSLIGGKIRSLRDYIYLDSINSIVKSIKAHKDSVIIELFAPSSARSIGYLPDRTYDNEDIIYEGPWIINTHGIGALSFSGFPLSAFVPDTIDSATDSNSSQSPSMECFPNPAGTTVNIKYRITGTAPAIFDVLDPLGRVVLPLGNQPPGTGETIGTYDLSLLSAGEYFLRMKAGNATITQKLILLK